MGVSLIIFVACFVALLCIDLARKGKLPQKYVVISGVLLLGLFLFEDASKYGAQVAEYDNKIAFVVISIALVMYSLFHAKLMVSERSNRRK